MKYPHYRLELLSHVFPGSTAACCAYGQQTFTRRRQQQLDITNHAEVRAQRPVNFYTPVALDLSGVVIARAQIFDQRDRDIKIPVTDVCCTAAGEADMTAAASDV